MSDAAAVEERASTDGPKVGRTAGPSAGRRALSAILPGLPQLLAGRRALGVTLLATWIGLLAVVVTRFDRVLAAPTGAWDDRLALVTLLAGLCLSWYWSWRDVSRPGRPSIQGASQWVLAIRAFSRSRMAVFGLLVIAAVYLVALIAPLIAPFDPIQQGDLVLDRLRPPTSAHLLGTDRFGRDILTRILYGARISLTIGFVAVGISVTIGTLLGAVSGYFGGRVDAAIMRLVDVIIAFPRLILLITIIALFEPSIFLIVVFLGLTLWPSTARLVRGEVLSLREREFIEAARALGYPRRRIIARHVIPNVLGPVIVAATLGIGHTIVLEAGLSFLGLGVQAPTPSWGLMVADGRNHLLDAWWMSTFPGLAIVFTVLSFNLVGDGLQEALDPRTRR